MASEMRHITLTPLDHIPPGNYTCSLTYLPLKPSVHFSQAFEVLRKGLQATFVSLPWLSGRVWPQSPDAPGWRKGQREIRYNTKDIGERLQQQFKYRELKSEQSYSEIKELAFPLDSFDDELLISVPFMPDINTGPDVFVAQANFIPGACLLTICGHHSATDGGAMSAITNLWADNCRALQSHRSEQAAMPLGSENSDRTVLERIWAKEWKGTHPVDPERSRVLGLDPPGLDSEDHKLELQCRESNDGQISKGTIFYISPANFIALQKDCRQDVSLEKGHSDSDSEISGIDAICALMWRFLLKVRVKAAQNLDHSIGENGNSDAVVRLDLYVNGRNDFSPSLPNPYLGNLTVVNQCFMPLSALTSSHVSLGTVARTIRGCAKSINPSSLLDAYTLARGLPDFEKLVLRNSGIDGSSMALSPLLMMPPLNFGSGVFDNGGKPDATRMLTRAMYGISRTGFILPKLANGGVEFVVNVFQEELELLLEDEEFGKYAMFLS
ncbi:hypothetical protein F5Y19DRAFT_52235 [Xylariaceae sp. FL1651]|nr:hypothetical protein F5Y19DRAFT_52235 [Xylariaceae sp. FL1651]